MSETTAVGEGGGEDVNPFVDPYTVVTQSDAGLSKDTTAATYQEPSKPPEYTSSQAQPSTQSEFGASQPNPTSVYQQPPFSIELPSGGLQAQGISPVFPVESNQTSAYTYTLNQVDLERRAGELESREQELNRTQQTVLKENNFPPVPSFCPWKPCYYHAIDIEIPISSQKSCKIMFYLWQFYVLTLLVNFIGSFALLIGGSSDADSAGATFGVSLVYMLAFTPCSFVFWYRPIYKALRDDSSFNYMLFFFIFFFQIVICVISALGIPSFGTVGWINGLAQIARGSGGVGALMIITGLMWTILSAGMILYYKKIHATYRVSGGSLEKAQGEVATGIASNKTVQNVAIQSMKAASGTQAQTRT